MQQLVCPLDEALIFANEINGNGARVTEADLLDATLQGCIGVWADFGSQFSALDGDLISRADAGLVRQQRAQPPVAANGESYDFADENTQQKVRALRPGGQSRAGGPTRQKRHLDPVESASRYIKFRTQRRHPTPFELEQYKLNLALDIFDSRSEQDPASDDFVEFMAATQEQVQTRAHAWAHTEIRVGSPSPVKGIKQLCVCAAVVQRLESIRYNLTASTDDVVVLSHGGGRGALLYRNAPNRKDAPTVVTGWPNDIDLLFKVSDISHCFHNDEPRESTDDETGYSAVLSAVAHLGGVDLLDEAAAQRLVSESEKVGAPVSLAFCERLLQGVQSLHQSAD
ncbi:MAG: hypothetical protein AAF499_04535 [Pseudomonadota bacterium]